MPLVNTVLNTALTSAFSSAMQEFLTITSQPGTNNAVDKSSAAISAASATFARIAAPAIDAYIKSATIIIPPGQLVATAGSPAAQAGATTAPSPPALIT